MKDNEIILGFTNEFFQSNTCISNLENISTINQKFFPEIKRKIDLDIKENKKIKMPLQNITQNKENILPLYSFKNR